MAAMNKDTVLRSAVRAAMASCLLWAALGANNATVVSAQRQPSAVQGAVDGRLDFTAQVYRRRTKDLIEKKDVIESLTKNDFRLFEDKREQAILSVTRETRPLSIVAVVMLGQGYRCEGGGVARDIGSVPRVLSIIATELEKNLTSEDELAILITDENGTMIREFGQPLTTLGGDFGQVARISQASQKAMGSSYKGSHRYMGVRVNYVDVALEKAVAYLSKKKKTANLPVVLFLRDIYNESNPMLKDGYVKSMTAALLQEQILVSWVGYSGLPLWLGLPVWYGKLPDLTGGDRESCLLYLFESEMMAVLERLRTRYRISYVSTNPQRDGRVRQLKLELAPQWQKRKDKPIVRAPQAIIAPPS